MGNSWLSSSNLAEHSASPSAICQAVVSNGDILLYGCEVGANEEGREFIGALARATGADITAYLTVNKWLKLATYKCLPRIMG